MILLSFYKSIYFILAKGAGVHQTHGKGNFVERWENVARKLRSVGAIGYERTKCDNVLNDTTTPNHFSGRYSSYNYIITYIGLLNIIIKIYILEDIEVAKIWLQTTGLTAPYDSTFIHKWNLTYEIKRADILGQCAHNLELVFNLWPSLQGPR